MKLIILLTTMFLGFSVTAEENCPSIDAVLSDMQKGVVYDHPYYEGTFFAPVERTMLCRLEKGNEKAFCDLKILLNEQVVKAAKDSFDVGEVTLDVIKKWEANLQAVKAVCGK